MLRADKNRLSHELALRHTLSVPLRSYRRAPLARIIGLRIPSLETHIMSQLRFVFILICFGLSACAGVNSKPDLARLYAREANNQTQPPIIVIHGLMGSTLVHKTTGEEFYPRGVSSVAFSDYRDLTISPISTVGDDLVPGKILNDIAGVDFYGALTNVLESAGQFKKSEIGQAVGNERRRYYTFLYDWRRDDVDAVKQLHEFINQIRIDYKDPNLRVDIVAHSNGGLITNYYLRYGPNDVLDKGPDFPQWKEGASRIRRVVLLGTPNLGSVTSLERLHRGFRLSLRIIPIEVLTSFATPFQALPSPIEKSVLDVQGKPLQMDIFDPEVWKKNQWSVYAPSFITNLEKTNQKNPEAALSIDALQTTFAKNLQRAKQFQNALTANYAGEGVKIAAFGGDCELTPHRVIAENINGKWQIAFKEKDIVTKVAGIDYEYLMQAPGDGLVPRASQDANAYEFLPLRQSFFLCETHEFLVTNSYFQNNLLYFLLSR
jgi:pimeloyl-ACP methyl ester carboxylesterase